MSIVKSRLSFAQSGMSKFPVKQEARAMPGDLGAAARAVAPLLGLILAALSCPAPVLASAFSATGWVGQEFYPAGSPGVSSVSPTNATFFQQFVAGAINLSSDAVAGSGNLHLLAFASLYNMTNWDSGHIWSSATATIHESVAPAWQFWNLPNQTLIFDYEVSVSGNMVTTSAGPGAAGSEARLEYRYNLGDSSGGGNWWQNSAGQVSKSGTWNGIISSSFTVQPNSTFDLNLLGFATAFGSKAYNPGSDTTIVANADFSHTMTWLGITGLRALDSQGNEVPLPPGAYIPLIGQDSGIDYWYSADAPAAVPEPATVLLLGSGLAVAGLIRKLGG